MPEFKDNFSHHSDIYSKYRPDYPEELFSYLSSLTQEHGQAWDVGTGNGQAAKALTNYFEKVYANDPSEAQIQNAFHHEKIIYKVEAAEHTCLPDHSVDLITVAQALHWFDIELFYAEVRRVLKHDGIIAVWTYYLPSLNPEIDALIKEFHDITLKSYWQWENALVAQQYKTLPFPFEIIPSPVFTIQKSLSTDEIMGLIRSWSAVQRFIQREGYDPLPELSEKINHFWKDSDRRRIATWHIYLRLGRQSSV